MFELNVHYKHEMIRIIIIIIIIIIYYPSRFMYINQYLIRMYLRVTKLALLSALFVSYIVDGFLCMRKGMRL